MEDTTPKLSFAIINPGYTVGEAANYGEVIVLKNLQGGSFSLANFSINYINSSGNKSKLLDFPAGSEMIGETLQLRLASLEEAADLSYSKTLAFKGGLELVYNDEVVDSVCWDGSADCFPVFNSKKPKVLVRNDESGEFELKDVEEVSVSYDVENPGIQFAEVEEEGRGEVDEAEPPHCAGLQFSEILSYYETSKTEQFIEFFNSTDTQIVLNGCALKYKNKTYELNGIVGPEEYFTYVPTDFTLTKNPTNQNELSILDSDGSTVDNFIYYNGQKRGVAMAQFGFNDVGEELWLATYAPTPGEENNYQKYKTCEEGKVINEETGNCVKATSVDTSLEACPEGKYRNPLTGRCKSYSTTSSSETKPCAEGYERNPETNRCRKIKTNTGADFSLPDETSETQVNFVALGAIIIVVTIGLAYLIWQFRKEIYGIIKKIFKKR